MYVCSLVFFLFLSFLYVAVFLVCLKMLGVLPFATSCFVSYTLAAMKDSKYCHGESLVSHPVMLRNTLKVSKQHQSLEPVTMNLWKQKYFVEVEAKHQKYRYRGC